MSEVKVPAWVYQHPDKLGEGAKRRRKLKDTRQIWAAVMHEWKRGTLRAGSGAHVKNRAQAVAIAESETKGK